MVLLPQGEETVLGSEPGWIDAILRGASAGWPGALSSLGRPHGS